MDYLSEINMNWIDKTELTRLIYDWLVLLSAPALAGSNTISEWVSQEMVKSDRPELTGAKVVISGGQFN